MADDIITLKSDADYAKVPDGKQFKAPDGTVRVKPYKIQDSEGYDKIPEGAHFTDPQGQLRVKPSYESISPEAQSIFDMTVNPKEQRNALEHFYGKDKIKLAPEGNFYVDQGGGKRLKPSQKSFKGSAESLAGSQGAPMTGAIGGELAGGLFGAEFGPPGIAAGSALGAGAGAAAGTAYNDAMLGVMGIYDRSPIEELNRIGEATNSGVTGSAGGRLVGAALGKAWQGGKALQGAVYDPRAAAAKIGRKVLGASGEDFETAVDLAKQGVAVPAKTWAKTAPYLGYIQNWAKQFGYDPVKDRAETFYNTQASKLAKQLGVELPEAATRATAAPSSEKAGQAVLSKARESMAAADAELNRVHGEALRRAGVASPDEKAASVRELQTAIEANEKEAQKIIDAGWKDIDKTRQAWTQEGKIGANPGDLTRAMADKIQAVTKAVKSRASVLYRAADAATNGRLPNIAPLQKEAEDFIKALPEGFAKKYPSEISAISKLGLSKTVKDEAGEEIEEAAKPITFGQLHQIRSFLRHGIDWQDLSPDFRAGALKKFSGLVNQVLHDDEAAPELQAAAKILDKTDAYYAKNMSAVKDSKIQNLVNLTEAGLPPNPSVIAKMTMEQEGGWTERMTKLRRLVGPKVWGAVKAADVQNIADASKTLVPGQINAQKFADEILKRYQSGVLENGYDKPAADLLLKQAQRIALKSGTLDFKLLPGDDLSTVMSRINAAQSRIDAIVSKDPYSALSSEVKRLEARHAARIAEIKGQRATEPLHFLNDASALAMSSADKILGSPDLLKAAAARFGPDSEEFTMLRQVGAQRMLQRSLGMTSGLGDEFKALTPDAQKLLFPNGLDKAVLKLGTEMKALFPPGSEGFGSNLSGAQLVTHPVGALTKVAHGVGKVFSHIPGGEAAARFIVSDALEKATNIISNPKTILFFAQRAQPLTDAEAEALAKSAAQAVKYGNQYGGTVGAAVGGASIPKQKQKVPHITVRHNWRDKYKQQAQ